MVGCEVWRVNKLKDPDYIPGDSGLGQGPGRWNPFGFNYTPEECAGGVALYGRASTTTPRRAETERLRSVRERACSVAIEHSHGTMPSRRLLGARRAETERLRSVRERAQPVAAI